jgi:hypothetical protein
MKRGYLLGAFILAVLFAVFLWFRPTDQKPGELIARVAETQTKTEEQRDRKKEEPQRLVLVSVSPPETSKKDGEIVLAGRVVSRASGEGIAGAELTFAQNEGSHSVISEGAGVFRFVAPASGGYQLASVSANGFQPFSPAWGESPLVFQARPGRKISDLLVYLDPARAPVANAENTVAQGASISGTTVDGKGDALPEVLVSAFHEEHDPFGGAQQLWTTRSDLEGKFALAGLLPGAYTLIGSAPSLVAARKEAVAAGTAGVELRLEENGGFIAGQVTSSSSPDGVASFAVVLSRPKTKLEEDRVATQSFLDPEGRYLLGPLAAGDYLVRIAAHGYATTEEVPVQVGTGQTTRADFELSKGATLLGTVRSKTSSLAVAGARVELEGRPIGADLPIQTELAVITKEDGSFSLSGIAPGLRAISVEARGYDTRLVSSLDVAPDATIGPIEVRLTPLATPDTEPKRELTGIGAALAAEGDVLLVGQVIEGGGAALAGVVPGDRIVAIDGKLVGELDMNSAVQRIRGPEGTSVRLTVRRAGGEEEIIHVFRRKIRA